ncbi:MAG: class I adenylate-forming enzyme family protein [Bradymonadaceae bacterium]
MTPSTPFRDRLFFHLRERPEASAIIHADRSCTFSRLDELARRYARGLLDRGVEKGDRVVCVMETCPELVTILVGNHLYGAIHVPVNTHYRGEELSHILVDSEPTVLIVDQRCEAYTLLDSIDLPDSIRHVIVLGESDLRAREERFESLLARASLEELPVVGDDDLALFIYTSGTTGPSKGVEHTFRSIVSGIDALTTLWQWTPADRLVLALPLFHVHGLCIGLHGTLLRGTEALLHDRFDPVQIAQAVDDGATIFMGVPTMYTRILRAIDDDPSLATKLSRARLFTSGSAALSGDVHRAFEAATGQVILERYGMSETLLTLSNPYDGERRPGTVGYPVPGVEARIVHEAGKECGTGEVGELWVRGPSVMRGYWRAPEKTAEVLEGEWFKTGDVVTRDEEGYFKIVGRRSVDIIKSGGFKISAREIEEVLCGHEDVEEVAVVGIPDDEWGERIVAAIVACPSARGRTSLEWLEELQGFAGDRLANFKKPREVFLFEELPRNALGKIQKHRIIQRDS